MGKCFHPQLLVLISVISDVSDLNMLPYLRIDNKAGVK